MISPYLSIIIPAYNAEHYIVKCLDSILTQPNSKYIEVIVVDDCSTDNTLYALNKYKKKYKNNLITIIRHTKNKQQGAARNTGLRHAHGKYVWFVDIDDYITENFLDNIRLLKSKNDTVDIFQFNSISLNMDGTTFHEEYLTETLEMSGLDFLEYEAKINYKNRIKATWSKWYRTDFLLNNSIFFKEHVYWEDVAHTLKCFILSKKVCYMPMLGYVYVQTPNSDMRGNQNGRKYADSIRFCVDSLELIKQYNLSNRIIEFLLPTYEKTLYKYKRNLYKLSLKDFLVFSGSLSKMNTRIVMEFCKNPSDYKWLNNKIFQFLVWMKILL